MVEVFIGVAIVVVAFIVGWFALGMPGPDDVDEE